MLNAASGGDDRLSDDSLSDHPLGQADSLSLGQSLAVLPRRKSLTAEEPLTNPWRNAKTLTQPRKSAPLLPGPAAPISPLRDRDLVIMLSWFDREDMPELEKDVNYHLMLLFPEPYWGEDKWEFLQDYL